MRSDRQRLLDILEAVDLIEKHTTGGPNAFEKDELVQTWVVYHLQIIGEAARGLTDDFRDKYAIMPWKQIIGMRHILVHHYFGIDLPVVWSVVENDLAPLKNNVQEILDELAADEESPDAD